jgi:hypothetical protein
LSWASEKENEEKIVQPYNVDVEKHEDMDNLRISGDEGGNVTDKRSRRGRKAQNYKELNSGVHGRTTSPRSRTSPRSPRAGMSPRQALSPLSSPKSELSSPVVKIVFFCKVPVFEFLEPALKVVLDLEFVQITAVACLV